MTKTLVNHRRSEAISKSLKSFIICHSRGTSASLLGFLLGTMGGDPRLNQANAGEIEILAGGKLLFGVTTAEDEQLSDGEGDRGYTFFADSELYIEADISPSDDLEVGAEIVLLVDADLDEVNAEETYMFATGAFGHAQLGRTEGAETEMALGANTIAAGTGGIDGDTENLGEVELQGSEDAAKISYYTPRIAGVQAGLSFTPDTGDDERAQSVIEDDEELEDLEDHVGLGLNFVAEFDEVEIGLAAVGSYGNSEDPARRDLDGFSIGGTAGFEGIELGASYGRNNAADDFEFATLGTTIGIGEANAGVGYNYLDEKADGITHVIAVSGDIEVLDGVELQADVSYADPEDRRTNLASVLAVELSF